MLPANRHLLPVLGIDIHIVLVPTPAGPVPVPIPHPFIGITFDVMDYIPKIGSTVNVNNIPRGISLTNGMLGTNKHIPIGGPAFAMMPLIGHNSMNFFGSLTVKAQGSLFAPAGFMVMTCNDFGVPLTLSPPPGKKFLPPVPSLYLPTSATIPIPAGKPVMVGGPYVPDLAGMLMGLAMSFGFGCLLKGIGKALNKLFRKFECTEGLADKLCKMGFEPVDLITGRVIYKGTDFEIRGPMPIRWDRSWYSDSGYNGPLGHGTHLCYDMSLLVDYDESATGVILADGRATAFPLLLNLGDSSYDRSEKLTLTNKGDHFLLTDHNVRWEYRFEEVAPRFYKLVRITNVEGLTITLSHDRKGQLTRLVDCAGREIFVSYNDRGTINSVRARHRGEDRLLVEYDYNEEKDLSAITDALGQTTHLYYEEHLMRKRVDRNGYTFIWDYQGKGRKAKCIHTSGQDGYLEGWISYHKGYNKVTESSGAVWLYYYNELNLCTKIVDPMGYSQEFLYTGYLELYREIDEEGDIRGYIYDDRGRLKTVVLPDNTSSSYVYNDDDTIKMEIDGNGQATMYNYNQDRLIRSEVLPDNTAIYYRYNSLRLLMSVSNEKDETITYGYDEDHNLTTITQHAGETEQWLFDAWGRSIQQVNPIGRAQYYTYDVLSRLRSVRQFDGAIVRMDYDAYDYLVRLEDAQRIIEFTYNPGGELTSRKEGESLIRFIYDRDNRLTALYNEAGEAYRYELSLRGDVLSEVGFDGHRTRYQRDRTGRVLRMEWGEGKWTSYEYDLAGRVVKSENSDSYWEAFSYDRNGEVIELINENSHVRLVRDPVGRVVREMSGEHSMDSVYDNTGNRIFTSSSFGVAIHRQFDHNFNVTGSSVLMRESEVWSSRQVFNRLGLETERKLPGNLRAIREYDETGRNIDLQVAAGARAVSHHSYAWDVNDRMRKKSNQLTGVDTRYGHDASGNLLWAQRNRGAVDYRVPDAVGNLYKTPEKADMQYGPGGKLLKSPRALYHYDQAGNLVKKVESDGQVWQYGWKDNGMLGEVTRPDGEKVFFEYDPFGRRTSKTYKGKVTRWLWDGDTPLHQWTYSVKEKPQAQVNEFGEISFDHPEPTADAVTWIFDEDSFSPAAGIRQDRVFSIVTDYAGTPQEAYDGNGERVWEGQLDIFGRLQSLKGDAQLVPFRFAGQYEDSEINLYYNNFRYYDYDVGRFISKDRIGLNSNVWNFYAYTFDPLIWSDPLGLDWNYALVDKNGNPYYHGRASDNTTLSDVRSRHSGTTGSDGARFDASKGDKIVQTTAPGTEYDAVRGIEQTGIEENGALLGRSSTRVRGNKINGINPKNKKLKVRMDAANKLIKKNKMKSVNDRAKRLAKGCKK